MFGRATVTLGIGPHSSWNSLSNSVVVNTVCLFKAHLDKFWMYQDVKYDFMSDLTRISDRAVHEMSGLYFLLRSND